MTDWELLVSTSLEEEKEVYLLLLRIPKVASVVPLIGEYNLRASIATKNYREFEKIMETVRRIKGVRGVKPLTVTMFEYPR